MDGFDDTSISSVADVSTDSVTDTSVETVTEPAEVISGLTGKLTEQITYALYNDKPHE